MTRQFLRLIHYVLNLRVQLAPLTLTPVNIGLRNLSTFGPFEGWVCKYSPEVLMQIREHFPLIHEWSAAALVAAWWGTTGNRREIFQSTWDWWIRASASPWLLWRQLLWNLIPSLHGISTETAVFRRPADVCRKSETQVSVGVLHKTLINVT